tara:strand:+ start:36 stop:416 length:381 start_codon:yes stop_codon:yes gene_type:complete
MHFASKAIIFVNNKYLLQLRDNKKNILYPNHWALFGGRFKKNENAKKCLIREIQEELLVKIKITMKLYECYNSDTKGYIHYFYAQPLKEIKFENLQEGQGIAWFTKKQIKKLKLAKDVKNILDYLN